MKKDDFIIISIITALFICPILPSSVLQAQNVAINQNGSAPHPSSLLDISSNSKGMLVPRMTSTQRQNIASPANGLLVFDITTNSFWYYAASWREIYDSGNAEFTLPFAGTDSDTGKIFSITNSSGTTGSTALYGKGSQSGSGIILDHTKGVWGDNFAGIGVVGTSANIGILGMTGPSVNAIGVKGVSASTALTSGAVTGVNTSTGVSVYGESSGGGIAIYGKTTRPNGAAIYALNDAANGQGIRGVATGADGVAVYGEAGSSGSHSFAGYFKNSNSSNTRNVVQIDNLGAGKSLLVNNMNVSNSTDLIMARNSGTGNFISLVTGFGDVKTTIAKNGNIATDGTVTVKNNKGIVRNTNSTQMRYEVVPAVVEALNGNLLVVSPHYIVERTIYFSTPFSAPPAVSVGNVTSLTGAGPFYFTSIVLDVTTTSCKFVLYNPNGFDLTFKAVWNLIAIGPE